MNSQVYFENIRERIIEGLDQCEFDLKIAIAWFTDKKLLSKVEELSKRGVKVKIIIYDDQINQKQLFENLYYNKAEIFLFRKLMHNKFCIIDGKTVINGSYNWTHSASTNEENIQMTLHNKEFANKFVEQFFKLQSKCKLIEVEISNERIILLEREFNEFYEERTICNLPYLIDCSNVEYSEINKFSVKPNGYYFIDDSDFERELLWVLFILNSDYPLNKLNKLLGKKYDIPHGYTYVDNVKFNNKIAFFQKEKIKVEERKKTGYNSRTNFVSFLSKDGEKSNRVRFSHKLKNGYYYDDSFIGSGIYNNQLVNVISGHFKFLGDDKGFVMFESNSKYGKGTKYGLIDLYGCVVVDNKFDDFEVDSENDSISFFEYPYYRYKNDSDYLWSTRCTYREQYKERSYAYKQYKYHFGLQKIKEEGELIFINNESKDFEYIFLSDENEKYIELYLAISNEYPGYDFSFCRNQVKSIDDLITLKQSLDSMPKKVKIVDPNKNDKDKGRYEKDGILFRPVIQKPYMVINDSIDKIEFLQKLQERNERLDSINRKHKTGKYTPKKEGCYIATMVYQDYNHPKVIALRNFRDEMLLKYRFGRWFVARYYKYSPNFVKRFQGGFWVKPIKVFVETIVYVLEKTYNKSINN